MEKEKKNKKNRRGIEEEERKNFASVGAVTTVDLSTFDRKKKNTFLIRVLPLWCTTHNFASHPCWLGEHLKTFFLFGVKELS